MIKNRKINNIEDVINQVKNLYMQSGFKISRIHADIEFEPLRIEMADLGISLNFTSKKEHFLGIGKSNRNVKVYVQSSQAAIPFKQISKLILVHLDTTTIFG